MVEAWLNNNNPEPQEAQKAQEPFPLMPCNQQALETFCALSSQWRHGPMGKPSGLDYAAINPTLSLMGITPTAELFAQIQILEATVLQELSESTTHD